MKPTRRDIDRASGTKMPHGDVIQVDMTPSLEARHHRVLSETPGAIWGYDDALQGRLRNITIGWSIHIAINRRTAQ